MDLVAASGWSGRRRIANLGTRRPSVNALRVSTYVCHGAFTRAQDCVGRAAYLSQGPMVGQTRAPRDLSKGSLC
jgi:hypothetical protein